MDILWQFSKKEQIRRYLFCAQHIQDGFYQKMKFYVLPFVPEKFRDRIVYFPFISSFLKIFAKTKLINMNTVIPKNVRNDIWKKAEKDYAKTKLHLEQLQNEWNIIKKKFITFLKDKNLNIQERIVISPTLFGTCGQYSMAKEGTLSIHPRFDRKTEDVLQLILAAIYHTKILSKTVPCKSIELLNKNLWYKLQKQLIQVSSLLKSDIHKSSKGMLRILYSNFAGNLAQKSVEYLKTLGYPLKSEIENIKQIKFLTKNERKVLERLIEKRNKIVTFDEISDLIWGKQSVEKYSLYAITKLIERVRKQIRKNGIAIGPIHTQRAKGYLLYD